MIGNLVLTKKFVPELINHKALVTECQTSVQINFSVYFKYKEIHDFAANQLEIMKNSLDNGEHLDNFWKFVTTPSLLLVLDRKKLIPSPEEATIVM